MSDYGNIKSKKVASTELFIRIVLRFCTICKMLSGLAFYSLAFLQPF